MTEERQLQSDDATFSYLKARVSRSALLKGAAAGLALGAVPGAVRASGSTGRAPYFEQPFFPQIPSGTYTTTDIQTSINVTTTAERLAVTLLTATVKNAGALGLNPLVTAVFQAALAEEQYHADFLDSLGATPLTTVFTVPDPTILSNPTKLLGFVEVAESLFVGHYIALTREFAELAQPRLAKVAAEIAAVESEHRALARATLALQGDATRIPPNNKAFATETVLHTPDTAKILIQLGFIGGSGTQVTYPGRDAALAAAGPMVSQVIQTTPSDATSSLTASDNLTGAR